MSGRKCGKSLDDGEKYVIFVIELRGCSSAGRALASHARGRRFDSAHLHNSTDGAGGVQTVKQPEHRCLSPAKATQGIFMLYKRLAAAIFPVLIILFLSQGCAKKETVPKVTLPEGKTAEVVFIVGDVYVRTAGGSTWRKAKVGDTLAEGTTVKTDEDSYCELVISSGTIFRMKDKSELLLAVLPENENKNKTLIRFAMGDLFTKAQKIAYRSADTIETDTVTLGVRGTEFLVHVEQGTRTEVLVADGGVRARMNIDIPPDAQAVGGMKPVLRKINRGVNIREGFKLEVTAEEVAGLKTAIEEISERGSVSPSEIEKLKEQSGLIVVPFRDADRRRMVEFKTVSLDYTQGETHYVSPNFDGINDEFVFSTDAYRNEKLYGWKLVISDGRSVIQQVIKNRITQEEEEVVLPEKIQWNMVNTGGAIVPDGNYVYEFFTSGRRSEDFLREKGIIVVDTLPPMLDVDVPEKTFSPNGDGVKDIIQFPVKAEAGAEWSCTIATPEEIIVKTIEWDRKMPDAVEWDGTGENGTVLPEGVYDITIRGRDDAGNVTRKTIRGVTIDIRERQAAVDIDNPVFSPNGDGQVDTVTFMPVLSDWSRIDTWDLIVQTDKGDTARRFRGRRYLPRKIVWDGKPKGDIAARYPDGLPSGYYTYFLKVIYRSGVNTYAFKKELILDNDPPVIDVSVSPELFSPDGDGRDDTLVIKPSIKDLTGIQYWKAGIYTADGMLFKEFHGTGMPAGQMYWDGISDTGILVDSGGDYYLEFEAVDEGFNSGKSEKVPFSIDILVIPTERGLKIRVSNIEFGFNTSELTGDKTFQILDKIVTVLKKYAKYSITIEGHTDSTGDESYNLELSRKRAESVGQYLIGHGIGADRLSYKGYGSKYPVDTNETKEGRRRNRRVEFLLIRK